MQTSVWDLVTAINSFLDSLFSDAFINRAIYDWLSFVRIAIEWNTSFYDYGGSLLVASGLTEVSYHFRLRNHFKTTHRPSHIIHIYEVLYRATNLQGISIRTLISLINTDCLTKSTFAIVLINNTRKLLQLSDL